jgi:hypothetical protein
MYLIFGILIPVAWIYIVYPFGDQGYLWSAISAAVFAAIGLFAAVAFMLVATRKN